MHLRHFPNFASEVPPSESSDSVSESGNDGVLGRCALLGGIASEALVWWRTMLAAGGLTREGSFVRRGLADARAVTVGATSSGSCRRRSPVLPTFSSARSCFLFSVVGVEGACLHGSSLFFSFVLCLLLVKVFRTAFLE